MNFRDLEYLAAVADTAHFGRAAEQCHVSQSALSLQLQKLERELGTQLFERTSRRVVVTPAGREAASKARDLLRQKQELIDDARHHGGGLPSAARIGAIPTIAPYLFEALHGRLRQRHPNTDPLFNEEVTEQLTQSVTQGRLDAGVLATPSEDSLIDELPIFEETFLLATPARHPLAKRTRVAPQDFQDESMLLLKDAHCLREQVLGFCSRNKVAARHLSVASSLETLLALVRAGAGVTLAPEMALGAKGRVTGVRCVPISPTPTRVVRVIYRKTSRTGRRLAEAIRDAAARAEERPNASQ